MLVFIVVIAELLAAVAAELVVVVAKRAWQTLDSGGALPSG
eukprot:CAMPEP_0168784476 /NCGR_PEP_ID=MMETSP0725-20121227/10240_1 /TAXON_ID=265536 /ORGANISM="Amphiprora sp., Strain CCMP467" /LENGTH=40 /DNA_ID= /DNA_START= /DNA_END= /DNA_ORIENTATION=